VHDLSHANGQALTKIGTRRMGEGWCVCGLRAGARAGREGFDIRFSDFWVYLA
jgi:hypothetical protein